MQTKLLTGLYRKGYIHLRKDDTVNYLINKLKVIEVFTNTNKQDISYQL